ncbi:MAG: hypothetical protein ABSG94_06535 [Brevinematales bacterium]
MESKKTGSFLWDYLKVFVFLLFIISFFLPFLSIAPFLSSFFRPLNLVGISILVVKNIFTHEDMLLIAAGLIFLLSLYLAPILYIVSLPARKFIRLDHKKLKRFFIFFLIIMYTLYLFICYNILPPSPPLLPAAVIFMVPVALFSTVILYYLKESYLILENCLICLMQPASYVLFWNFFISGGRNYLYGAYIYFILYAVLFVVSFIHVFIYLKRRPAGKRG